MEETMEYYYHGTSTRLVGSILREGLQPRGETLAPGEEPGVFFATRPERAVMFSYYACGRYGGRPVVLRVRADAVRAQSLQAYGLEDCGQVYSSNPVPPDAIAVGWVEGVCDECARGAWWACCGCWPHWTRREP
jgi:RNA:NAD 2'-phosphotransferase (TPT1/KptA family)